MAYSVIKVIKVFIKQWLTVQLIISLTIVAQDAIQTLRSLPNFFIIALQIKCEHVKVNHLNHEVNISLVLITGDWSVGSNRQNAVHLCWQVHVLACTADRDGEEKWQVWCSVGLKWNRTVGKMLIQEMRAVLRLQQGIVSITVKC